MGLKQRILAAQSEQEIEKLMDEGETYLMANEKTRRQWRRAANNRYNEIVRG